MSLGFRRTETVPTLEAMVEAIQRQPPDLVLCEAQGAADELCGAIQQLRQGAAGYNPFIVIIVTAWEKSSALITKVVNSGADDLLLRPFSTALLGARIEAHIERRKGFVITTDYVGPDRRKRCQPPGRHRDVRSAQFAEDEGQGQSCRPTSSPRSWMRNCRWRARS